MNRAVIEIDDVHFSYDSIPILEGISLQIEAGEFIGIIGPNASGKSTLLKLILGLLRPDKGTIKQFNDMGKSIVNDRMGYVPQHVTFSRNFPMTVTDAVLMGSIIKISPFGFNKAQVAAANQAMQSLEIEDIAKRQVSLLSGGQIQRVLIARALVCQPEILILDEPTANVDLRMEENIYSFLKHYNECLTVIVVSHDVAFISSYVDRVACLNKTLVCHNTESISGKVIDELYGAPVKMVHHEH